MEKIKPDLEHIYENLRGVLYHIVHCQDEFERNCFARTDTAKNVKSCINDALKTIVADVYIATEIVSEVLSSESDTDIEQILSYYNSIPLAEESITNG